MRSYAVSRDKGSGLWYVHQEGYAWLPVFGSFTKSRAEAQRQAALYSGFLARKEYSDAKVRGRSKTVGEEPAVFSWAGLGVTRGGLRCNRCNTGVTYMYIYVRLEMGIL